MPVADAGAGVCRRRPRAADARAADARHPVAVRYHVPARGKEVQAGGAAGASGTGWEDQER